MYLSKVISYKNAWESLKTNHGELIQELLDAVSDYEQITFQPKGSMHYSIGGNRAIWEQVLEIREWQIPPVILRTEGKRILLKPLGPIKDGISAIISGNSIDPLSRWLFHNSTIAMRNKIIQLPILILPSREFGNRFEKSSPLKQNIEQTQSQLEMLVPLSHPYPFLILGYSDQNKKTEIIELPSDPLMAEEKITINRCIEFPPEYHQAGLNILNFFGTYLREQYPHEDAKVKIEQDGLFVRLIVESRDGKLETLEKALHEYELIISGAELPEKIIQNERLIMELQNELKFAKLRIEVQQDVIGLHERNYDKLAKLMETGLSNKTPVNIDFKPIININNSLTINQDISNAIGCINELKTLVPQSSNAYIVLKELEGSMEAVEQETNPEVVKTSPAMSKFKKFIESVNKKNSEIGKVIKTGEAAWGHFKNLAGKYNSIAEWCGLPQIPKIFTK